MVRKKAKYILNKDAFAKIWGNAEEHQQLSELLDIEHKVYTPEEIKDDWSLIKDTEVIISGWGAPHLDEEFLNQAPKLKALFYGAGSIRGIVTDAMWERGILITSAYAANAIPVAEFCVSQILFALKCGWQYVRYIQTNHTYPDHFRVPGGYKSTVGIITLGMIGTKTLEKLRAYDVNIIVYCISMNEDKARGMGVKLVTLEEVFSQADVVSLHTPNLPQTRGMITGLHLASMKHHATFINSARGAVVRQNEMLDVLRKRPDLIAVLDVTDPEPPPAGDPIYELPNVILTPHIAGSMYDECRRMAQYAINDLRDWLAGKTPEWAVSREKAAALA